MLEEDDVEITHAKPLINEYSCVIEPPWSLACCLTLNETHVLVQPISNIRVRYIRLNLAVVCVFLARDLRGLARCISSEYGTHNVGRHV
jgi:hypothetical protein